METKMPEWMQAHARQLGVYMSHLERPSWLTRFWQWFTGADLVGSVGRVFSVTESNRLRNEAQAMFNFANLK